MSRSADSRNHLPAPYIASFACLATYRLPVMQLVCDHFDGRLRIFTGDRAYDPAIRLIEPDALGQITLHNVFLPRQLLFQRIFWREYLRCDVLLLDLNPRLLQAWPLLILRRLMRRPTALWGHAWPRAGRSTRSAWLRHAMRGLATVLVAYTETQAQDLRGLHPDKQVYAAPNALFHRADCVFDARAHRDTVVYVGRLTEAKKPLLLMEAFEKVAGDDPTVRLTIVGDGPQLETVSDAAAHSPYASRISVLGHISDQVRLKEIYARCIVSVSPGYVGLSATQSFAFGVPMIISRTEPHAPEIEAAEEGINCLFFETDDAGDLARSLELVVSDRESWHSRGPGISAQCGETYSVERMAQGLIDSFGEAR